MKLLGVINPISGGNDKDEFLTYLEETARLYGISICIYKTTGKDDQKKLIEVIASENPDKIIAAGGDGTFALAALASMKSQIPVGIIPFGSANGMAKELGVQLDFESALDDILKSSLYKSMDIVCINGKFHCIHLADVGLNARVVKSFNSDEKRGMLIYGKYMAAELNEMDQMSYTIESNGETHRGTCVMIAIANGRKFGTGVPVNHSGNPFDGKFEIVIIKDINFETIVKAGLSIFDDLLAADNMDKIIQTDLATITFDKPQLMQSDGEVIGTFEKLDISMLKQGFRLITNYGNPYLTD